MSASPSVLLPPKTFQSQIDVGLTKFGVVDAAFGVEVGENLVEIIFLELVEEEVEAAFVHLFAPLHLLRLQKMLYNCFIVRCLSHSARIEVFKTVLTQTGIS